MSKQITDFCEVVENLFAEQQAAWNGRPCAGQPPSKEAVAVKQSILGMWDWQPVTSPENLAPFLPKSGQLNVDQESVGRYMFLPPLSSCPDCVPVLTYKGDFEPRKSNMEYRLLFIRRCDDDKNSGDATAVSELWAMGFRFEYGVSIHEYHHVQLIRSIKQGGDGLLTPPLWLADRDPAIPVTANGPVSLLLCLIMSTYGCNFLGTFASTHKITCFGTFRKLLNVSRELKANF